MNECTDAMPSLPHDCIVWYIINLTKIKIKKHKHRQMKQTKNELLMGYENLVMKEYAMLLNITPMEIIKHNKSSHISDIRHLYCKLRYERHGISYSATGREIGRAHTTVKYAISRINDLILMKDKRILELWQMVMNIPGYETELIEK